VPTNDNETSEVGTVRRRLFQVREAPRGVSILGAEKASDSTREVRRNRDWLKLAELTASSILLLPGRANGWDRRKRALDSKATMAKAGDGPLRSVQRGGQRAATER
jgi:hypothetical protein